MYVVNKNILQQKRVITNKYLQDPPFVFTEDYQTELMMHHHEAFDILRKKNFFIGEHIWNFADFLTVQGKTHFIYKGHTIVFS